MPRALVMDWGGVLTDGPDMLDLVRRAASAGVRTALLSDATSVPQVCSAAFDVVVLGGSLGVRKPDPEAFHRVAALLGVGAGESVVVDDLIRNVRGARAAGEVVVHHTDVAVTIMEGEILLGL